MSREIGANKKKKEQRKINRIKLLLNIDLCACGGGHQLRCSDLCRALHTDDNTGRVECTELYQIGNAIVNQDGPRRSKREWRYGRQKNNDNVKENAENKITKQRRREKIERDRS